MTGPGVALQRIAALALGDPYPEFKVVEADPAVLEPQFGVYKVEGEGQRRFYARDGQLYTQRSGGSESKVFAAGNDRYFYGPSSLNWFEITRDAAGAYVMEMHANGALTADKATRIGPIPPEPKVVDVPRSVLERYAGSYQARMGKATVALGEADGLTIQLGGQRPTRLKPVSATQFHVEGVDARIVFQVEGDKASGLVIHQGGREIAVSRTAE